MKPIIPFILSTTLALSGFAVFAASEPVKSPTQSRHTTVAQKKAPSFIFVLQAKGGEIKQNKAGQYELILNKADVNHVIIFSDRPYRIVKYTTGKNLAKDWSVGTNSFKDDPPNAVLSGTGMKAKIVILSSIKVTGNSVVFGLHGYTGDRTLTMGDVTVVSMPINVMTPVYSDLMNHVGTYDPLPPKEALIDKVEFNNENK